MTLSDVLLAVVLLYIGPSLAFIAWRWMTRSWEDRRDDERTRR